MATIIRSEPGESTPFDDVFPGVMITIGLPPLPIPVAPGEHPTLKPASDIEATPSPSSSAPTPSSSPA